jgi:hypothetical protein
MASTKNKKNTPQLTRRVALTTPPGVFSLLGQMDGNQRVLKAS